MEERFRNLDYQNWKPVRTLGTDSYGTVYEIARDDGFGMVDHAALKVLSIPAAPEDFDALVAEGRTPEEVTALLHRQVETIARQLMAVDAISDEPNLLRCEDHVIRAHPDGRGWDIYVRTELLPSLPDYLRNHPHGEADIIRLGAGLCSALETCHRRGIVHGDIKPRNVFVGGGNFNEQVTYKLGDFGMAQFSAVDNTNDFMAPEVLCGAEVSPESDLYSVGMVLYWALNERRIPFVPLPPTAVEASDLAIAREQRLRGDPLPEPLHGSQALKNVVMRACADDPAQRYASVEEFRAMVGHGIRNLVTQFSPEAYRDEAHVDGTLAQFSAYYGAHSMDHTRPYSGIPALLSRLRDAGICLAVCSNKADDFSRQLIEHYFPGRFSLVRGKRDGVPVKPDPAVVSALLEALHADPTTALFVGDSSVDIQTGHNAGLVACGVTWGFRSRQSLIDAGADFLSDTADALERLILGSL